MHFLIEISLFDAQIPRPLHTSFLNPEQSQVIYCANQYLLKLGPGGQDREWGERSEQRLSLFWMGWVRGDKEQALSKMSKKTEFELDSCLSISLLHCLGPQHYHPTLHIQLSQTPGLPCFTKNLRPCLKWPQHSQTIPSGNLSRT